jgi:hypothetical protein
MPRNGYRDEIKQKNKSESTTKKDAEPIKNKKLDSSNSNQPKPTSENKPDELIQPKTNS